MPPISYPPDVITSGYLETVLAKKAGEPDVTYYSTESIKLREIEKWLDTYYCRDAVREKRNNIDALQILVSEIRDIMGVKDPSAEDLLHKAKKEVADKQYASAIRILYDIRSKIGGQFEEALTQTNENLSWEDEISYEAGELMHEILSEINMQSDVFHMLSDMLVETG